MNNQEIKSMSRQAEKGDIISFPPSDSEHIIIGRLVPVGNKNTEPTSGLLSKLPGMAGESECERTTVDENHTDKSAGGDDGAESE